MILTHPLADAVAAESVAADSIQLFDGERISALSLEQIVERRGNDVSRAYGLYHMGK
jgi:hypothetical protein